MDRCPKVLRRGCRIQHPRLRVEEEEEEEEEVSELVVHLWWGAFLVASSALLVCAGEYYVKQKFPALLRRCACHGVCRGLGVAPPVPAPDLRVRPELLRRDLEPDRRVWPVYGLCSARPSRPASATGERCPSLELPGERRRHARGWAVLSRSGERCQRRDNKWRYIYIYRTGGCGGPQERASP